MGVGKVPGQTEGNHDNLESGNHQAPSQLKP